MSSRKKRTLLVEVRAPERATLRERDADALATLARLLELGANPHPHARFTEEPWHTIISRYLSDDYERADKKKQTELIARHFWLRRTVYPAENQKTSVGAVVAALKAGGVSMKDSTVRSVALREKNRTDARAWIAKRFRQHRKEFTRDSVARALLAQFDSGEVSQVVQSALASLHHKSPAKG